MDPIHASSEQTPEFDMSTPDIEKMTEVIKFDEARLENLKIVHTESTEKDLLKAFRELRTRLLKHSKGENFVCLVSSVSAGGGCSYVARNLASVITMDKTKTALLVDCNLYAPSADQLLPKAPALGLTDFLDNDRVSVEHIVCASGIPRLRVITVGNNCDGGTEKITSDRMKRFIDEIKLRYSDRMIIIDGPSVGEYDAESRILADLCDFAVIVVPDNNVTEAKINEAVASIGKEKVAGLVLDKVDP